MTRVKYIIGNWKMHKTREDAKAFLESLSIEGCQARVGLAVPYTAISAISGIMVGAQNVSEYTHGAYTGEISAEMLVELGATFTLIGHSERRTIYGESDEVCRQKLERAKEAGLLPIFCVGESEREREEGKTDEVVKRQLDGVSPEGIVVAYEPVWAIGTGKTATPEIAETVHETIRSFLGSSDVSILYGGSVKPDNVAELMAQPNIDGALVGGASLDPETFSKLCTQGAS